MKLRATGLNLSFDQPNHELLNILDIDHLIVEEGQKIGIVGPSGAGKTTLMNVLVGIQPLESGQILWDDHDITQMSEMRRDLWRRNYVGMIFQDFYLFPGLSILGNVLLPATFGRIQHRKYNKGQLQTRALTLLQELELPDRRRSITTLSRGERQRVAIARALLLEPKILVADEPTANLDRKNADNIRRMLMDQVESIGSTLLLVSHDKQELEQVDQVFELTKGHFEDQN